MGQEANVTFDEIPVGSYFVLLKSTKPQSVYLKFSRGARPVYRDPFSCFFTKKENQPEKIKPTQLVQRVRLPRYQEFG